MRLPTFNIYKFLYLKKRFPTGNSAVTETLHLVLPSLPESLDHREGNRSLNSTSNATANPTGISKIIQVL